MTVRDFRIAFADCWPDKRDVPYMLAAYGIVGLLVWIVCRHDDFRTLVMQAAGQPLFWQIVCAGLVVYLIAAAYLFYRDWKEPLT